MPKPSSSRIHVETVLHHFPAISVQVSIASGAAGSSRRLNVFLCLPQYSKVGRTWAARITTYASRQLRQQKSMRCHSRGDGMELHVKCSITQRHRPIKGSALSPVGSKAPSGARRIVAHRCTRAAADACMAQGSRQIPAREGTLSLSIFHVNAYMTSPSAAAVARSPELCQLFPVFQESTTRDRRSCGRFAGARGFCKTASTKEWFGATGTVPPSQPVAS